MREVVGQRRRHQPFAGRDERRGAREARELGGVAAVERLGKLQRADGAVLKGERNGRELEDVGVDRDVLGAGLGLRRLDRGVDRPVGLPAAGDGEDAAVGIGDREDVRGGSIRQRRQFTPDRGNHPGAIRRRRGPQLDGVSRDRVLEGLVLGEGRDLEAQFAGAALFELGEHALPGLEPFGDRRPHPGADVEADPGEDRRENDGDHHHAGNRRPHHQPRRRRPRPH